MTKEQKTFSIFLKNLDWAFSQFIIWKNLKNNKYNKIFSQNTYIWTTLIRSLILGFLAELAKLTEKQNPKYGETVSVFYLLESELGDYKETLEKIKKLRNEVLMHNNLDTLLNLDTFMNKINLKYGDIEDIFQKLIHILDGVKSNFHDTTDCKKYFSDLEIFCVEDLKKFMASL